MEDEGPEGVKVGEEGQDAEDPRNGGCAEYPHNDADEPAEHREEQETDSESEEVINEGNVTTGRWPQVFETTLFSTPPRLSQYHSEPHQFPGSLPPFNDFSGLPTPPEPADFYRPATSIPRHPVFQQWTVVLHPTLLKKRKKLEKRIAHLLESTEKLKMYQLHLRVMCNDIEKIQSKAVVECDEDSYSLQGCQSSDLLKGDVYRLAQDSKMVTLNPPPHTSRD